MENCEKLINAGVDMPALLKRLMGNEALVSLFIRKFLEDTTFAQLKAAFAADDAKAAEMASHTLKGMCGNLSLTELYALFTKQVELIRGGDMALARAMMEELDARYDHTITQMKAWLAQR